MKAKGLGNSLVAIGDRIYDRDKKVVAWINKRCITCGRFISKYLSSTKRCKKCSITYNKLYKSRWAIARKKDKIYRDRYNKYKREWRRRNKK